MPVPASPRRLAWEAKYRETQEANFQLYCINGHSVGDEMELAYQHQTKGLDNFKCPYCGAGRPFLYRWEVD